MTAFILTTLIALYLSAACVALPSSSHSIGGRRSLVAPRKAGRSQLARRQVAQCYHNDDCGVPLANGNRACQGGFCYLNCNQGFEGSGGACHRSAGKVCSPGYFLYDGTCLSGPTIQISTRRCNRSLDCPAAMGTRPMSDAHPFCDMPDFAAPNAGTCTVRCFLGTVWSPRSLSCVDATSSTDLSDTSLGTSTGGPGAFCTVDSQCAGGAPGSNFVGYCNTSSCICAVACATGFTLSDAGVCVAVSISAPKCATTTCLPIRDGTSSCRAGVCSYSCNSPLATVSCTGDSCTCSATMSASDPLDCGEQHLVCPGASSAYAGLDQPRPACVAGACTLTCGSQRLLYRNGQAYCA